MSEHDGRDIHDLIEELTRPHPHREHYTLRKGTTTWSRDHVTLVPALVHQLLLAEPTSTDSPGSGGFKSQPAAHLEAIDTLAWIDLEAGRWVRDLGEVDPIDAVDETTGMTIRGSGAIACLTKLHGLWASATTCRRPKPTYGPVESWVKDRDTGSWEARQRKGVKCCTQHSIEHDVRRWWTQARIVSGWDSAAWRPANTCPACEQRGGLRVRLAAEAAVCIECRETWDRLTIGLLAEHIRTENFEDAQPEREGA
ncbi:MAG: hypothetical protein ACRDTJ_32590 [Pseudonocardiaceae bacterium]